MVGHYPKYTMRAIEFLLEYDVSKTLDTYGEALYCRASGNMLDGTFDPQVEDRRGQQLLGLQQGNYHTWDEKIVEWFEKNDPTGGKFVLPMIRWYIGGSMQSLEDAPSLRGRLRPTSSSATASKD
jgi:hypothetical protein